MKKYIDYIHESNEKLDDVTTSLELLFRCKNNDSDKMLEELHKLCRERIVKFTSKDHEEIENVVSQVKMVKFVNKKGFGIYFIFVCNGKEYAVGHEPMIFKVKRTISPLDPYGEEVWE